MYNVYKMKNTTYNFQFVINTVQINNCCLHIKNHLVTTTAIHSNLNPGSY